MIDWFKKVFGGEASSNTAKERLRLVLMTDHLALAPEIIENMKRDLVDVISRYVEVDREKVEVNFEREDRALAMLANIPITNVNRPVPPPEEPKPATTSSHAGRPPTRRRRKKPQVASNPATAPQ
jgi:cell division topological specificity factor